MSGTIVLILAGACLGLGAGGSVKELLLVIVGMALTIVATLLECM